VAWHFIKEPGFEGNDLWLAGGCYEIGLAKRDGVWRITAMTLACAWAAGNRDLPSLASASKRRLAARATLTFVRRLMAGRAAALQQLKTHALSAEHKQLHAMISGGVDAVHA